MGYICKIYISEVAINCKIIIMIAYFKGIFAANLLLAYLLIVI